MSKIKVKLNPDYGDRPDNADGGIRRVTEAQKRFLPDFDVEVVSNPKQADLINNHGTQADDEKGIPIVHSGHGLMWSRYAWDEGMQEVNAGVVHAMKIAQAHTAPSEWVAVSLRRGMMVYPEVVYHGVEPTDWEVQKNPEKYILWNKARQDFVSDSADMFRLARLMPNVPFVSTIGIPTKNVKVTGAIPFPEMKTLVQNAGLYLATARETFGIGTLEALASGVPVVGWDWGGQSEIIVPGETGLLAPPGDYEALIANIYKVLENRDKYSLNARLDVEARWTWQPRIAQYAAIYQRTLKAWNAPRVGVSVILTAHNLGKYIGDALKSVQRQTMTDWECIIVDDMSTDGTKEIAENFVNQDKRFRYFKTPTNLKLPMARNFGVAHSKGRYVIMLDADDMLEEQALRILFDEMEKDKSIHIAYGHLDVISDDGSGRKRNEWPYGQYSWRGQMAHLNQLPYSAMMRREVFERSGGYRQRHWRAEDANFWCRVTSFGFVAKKVTERSLLIYRMRVNSKSRGEPGDGDWTQWFPWRIAGSPREATERRTEIEARKLPDPAIVPFGAQGRPGAGMRFWHAHDYSYPRVSVVIPVGPGHERYVIDAVESVMAQTYPDWEIIVVNDTGKKWPKGMKSPLAGAPYAKIIQTSGNVGVAAARNLGFKHARGEAFFPLDADDYILPNCLERMVAHLEQYDGLIYSGWLKNTMDGKEMEYYQPVDFECGKILEKMWHSGSSILFPRWLFEKTGGWDEKIAGWEDWDFLINAQHHGCCSYVIKEPLFVYRFHSGTQRESSWKNKEAIVEYINQKWYAYRAGEKTMGCGCKAKKPIINNPASTFSSSGNFAAVPEQESVLLEYHGPHDGPVTIRGPVTGHRYRFGRLSSYQRKFVRPEDAKALLSRYAGETAEFTVAGKTAEVVAIPEPFDAPKVPEMGMPS